MVHGHRKRYTKSERGRKVSLANVIVIDSVHQEIHNKNYFDFQRVFEDVADNNSVYVSIRPTTKSAHLIVTTEAEGTCRFKSYVDTTWTADGTIGNVFNRYINDAPTADTVVYYDGTVGTLGVLRFDQLIAGGTGPRSTGGSGGNRVESILGAGHEITIELTNTAGQTKDIGITVEWYETK